MPGSVSHQEHGLVASDSEEPDTLTLQTRLQGFRFAIRFLGATLTDE